MNYSVKKLSKLAGVSIRTLHHYDQIELLTFSIRTEKKYRLYGENELLRLQQILFYKELNLPLKEIKEILDDPEFDILKALESHKKVMNLQKRRIITILDTIEKTINKLRKGAIMKHEELYEGLPKEKAAAYRKEAIEKWGTKVTQSETHLRKMGKDKFQKLGNDFNQTWKKLASMVDENPETPAVQQEVAKHYHFIRQFWGTVNSPDQQKEAYIGLGQLYIADERYTVTDDKPNPEFGQFISKAITCFAENNLK